MKKRCRLCLIALLVALPLFAQTQNMSVQVKQSSVRSSPSFLGNIIQHVTYADTLHVLANRGDWANVALPNGKSGWIHASALSEKKIVLRSGSHEASSTASSDEIMLAGKGFSAEVEADYRSKNTSLNYDRLDKMEKYAISQKQLGEFMREGKLSLEGAAQ